MYNLINFSLVKCDKLHLLKPFLKRYNCIKKTDLFNHLNKKLKTKNLLNIIKTDIILTHFYGDHYSESNGIYILD